MSTPIQRRYSFALQNKNANRTFQPNQKILSSHQITPQSEESRIIFKKGGADLSFSNSKQFLQSKQKQDCNITSQKLAEFKKCLYQRHGPVSPKSLQFKPFNIKFQFQEEQVKRRLQSKIMQAHQKLEQIKSSIKHHQQVKAQIIAKSDSRRNSMKKTNTT